MDSCLILPQRHILVFSHWEGKDFFSSYGITESSAGYVLQERQEEDFLSR